MAMTIEDYKKMYEQARAAGDAAGMQAANDGANAIRAAQGAAPEYAAADIAKIAAQSSSYTPVNATSAAGIDRAAYNDQVRRQQQYIASNPSAVQGMSTDEKYADYGDLINSTVRSGYYTSNAADAQRAAAAGLGVTETVYNGQDGWYRIDRAERTTPEGSSGADQGPLNDYDYAIVQKLKQDYADAQAQYKAAVAAGDTSAAEAARQSMEDAHLAAERVRAGYNYSGGADGSMYITYGALGVDGGGSGSSGSGNGSYGGSGYGGYDSYGSGILSGLVEDHSGYLQQMYAAQKAGALARLQAAYESNLAALDRAGTGVAEAYQAARNNTAGASELSKRNFAEYAAASGLNSGTGGQAELARNVTLQNDLNGINTAEADTLADLELQRAKAEVEYNSAIAQAEAEGDYSLAAALYQEKVRVQEALIDLTIQQWKLNLQ